MSERTGGIVSAFPPSSGIVLVPHTHWDREWYEPFQVFRYRLVGVIDSVLAMAEADPRFRFTLDGQTAAIEDYLEIKPENRRRVEALVGRGQLALGPWQILLDEFLCSGETIVRNLQMGMAGAAALGGAMRVGYLPDMFGHIAQMPQILRSAGIQHASLWRGVPSAVTEHAFSWQAPDGSTVRVEYFFDGYGNALDLIAIPENIHVAVADYRRRTDKRFNGAPILGMLGTDHLAPDPRLMEYVDRYSQPDFPITVATIEGYVNQFDPDDKLGVIRGELRSHARGNILPGVFSIRRNLKVAMARAEALVLEAERAAAIYANSTFEPFLGMAWRRIIESSAHDSVVGSGTDETVQQVDARLQEAAQLARAVRDDVFAAIASTVPATAHVAINALPVARRLQVEVTVPIAAERNGLVAELADGTFLRIQEMGELPVLLGDEVMDSALVLQRMMNRIHGRELFGQLIDSYTIAPGVLEFTVAEVPEIEAFDIAALASALEAALHENPGEWIVRIRARPRIRVLAELPVAAMGTTAFRVRPGTASPLSDAATEADRTVANGIVSARVDEDGTVTLGGQDGTVLTGIGALVDGGDIGDSYNYGPPGTDDLITEPSRVEIETVMSGPLRSVLRITRWYRWPRGIDRQTGRRASETVEVPVVMDVEVRRGEPFVRFGLRFTNEAADHRLRMHIPLPDQVTGSVSEGQFAVTARGLTAEGGGGEYPLPTFPAYSFVSAGAATVLVEGATEYEVVEGNELALTLLRAVGSISVNTHPLRDEPAASEVPIPTAQELGTSVEVNFGVIASGSGWEGADAVRLSDHFGTGAAVVRGRSANAQSLPAPFEGIRLEGRDVRMTSLRRLGEDVELRVVLLSNEGRQAQVAGSFAEASTVDLTGGVLETEAVSNGRFTFTLRPWEIRTIRLRG